MGMIESTQDADAENAICRLDWAGLTMPELTDAAWAYYHFSIQFRESLMMARAQYPDDTNLARLEREECDTANLSPYPGVADAGERMDHDVFMHRTLALEAIEPARLARLEAAGERYLATTRAMDAEVQAMSIVSYEDGGLEHLFLAMLQAPAWNTPLLQAFRHFLEQHIQFDSDAEAGHGALARHIPFDARVNRMWGALRDLFLACVPRLDAQCWSQDSDAA